MTANLEHVWTQTVAQWDTAASHDELFRLVHMHDAWLWAARNYREYAKAHPGDTVAARQLKKLQGYLMVTLTPREKPARNPYRATVSILAMMLIALGVGSVFTKMSGAGMSRSGSEWESGIAVSADEAPAEVAQVPVPEADLVASAAR